MSDVMLDSPADVTRQFLIDESLVSLPSVGDDWPMFVGHLTDVDREDTCLSMNTTPIKDGRLMLTGLVNLHYGIQLSVRTKKYETGWLKSENLQTSVSALHTEMVSLNGRQYRLENATKVSATFIGVDERRRNVFVSNYIMTVQRLS